jgi:hypothetical protein
MKSNLKASAHQRKQWPESRDSPQSGRRVFTSYSVGEGLFSRPHKKLKNLNTKIINNPIYK